MITKPMRSAIWGVVVAIAIVMVLGVAGARAAAPVKEVLASHIGWHVDKTKVDAVQALEAKGGKPTPAELQEENVCTVASKDECQPGEASSEPGGFEFARFTDSGFASAGSTSRFRCVPPTHPREVGREVG